MNDSYEGGRDDQLPTTQTPHQPVELSCLLDRSPHLQMLLHCLRSKGALSYLSMKEIKTSHLYVLIKHFNT